MRLPWKLQLGPLIVVIICAFITIAPQPVEAKGGRVTRGGRRAPLRVGKAIKRSWQTLRGKMAFKRWVGKDGRTQKLYRDAQVRENAHLDRHLLMGQTLLATGAVTLGSIINPPVGLALAGSAGVAGVATIVKKSRAENRARQHTIKQALVTGVQIPKSILRWHRIQLAKEAKGIAADKRQANAKSAKVNAAWNGMREEHRLLREALAQ